MKEKIDRFSKGIFEYEQPEIEVSPEVLDVFVNEGGSSTNEIIISNSKNTVMKGVVYSSSNFIKLENNRFVGVKNVITYTVDCNHLEQGRQIEAVINIVSDCGEHQIPVKISVLGTTCQSSIGHVGNLFQFANLAKTDWGEAVAMFRSEEFRRSVIRNERERDYLVAYNALIKSSDPDSALEEFLCVCKKKTECTFFVGKAEINLELEKANFMEKIPITKSQWGWIRLSVESDVPFLVPERDVINYDDFISGKFELRIAVKLVDSGIGLHMGNIRIFDSKHSVTIPVRIHVLGGGEIERLRRRNIRNYELKILERYIDFRTEKISNNIFLSESVKLTESVLMQIDKDIEQKSGDVRELTEMKEGFELYRAYLAVGESKHFRDDELVKSVLLKKNEALKEHSRYYPIYLYIEALSSKNKEIGDSNLQVIRRAYEENPSDTLLFWILLYMDSSLAESREYRYERILAQFARGDRSPILTYEAASIVRSEPGYIRNADSNECRILSFMIRHDMITLAVAQQFAICTRKEAENDEQRLKVLIALYRAFNDLEILKMIVKKAILLDHRETRYHEFFRAAVEQQLSVDGIYEYFIYTMDGRLVDEIPQPALLYFGYTPGLDNRSLELLYAYVIRNKEKNRQIYRAYLKNMEQLTVNSLKEGRITPLLSTIYADVVSRPLIESDHAIIETLPDILFANRITCDSPAMTGVCVVNDEEEGEAYYPLVDGTADVYLYTDTSTCFFIDEKGNRYIYSECGQLTKYIHMQDILGICYDLNSENKRLLINMWEKNNFYNNDKIYYINLQKQISSIPTVKKEIRNDCDFSLAEYYYNEGEPEMCESYLHSIDLTLLDAGKRSRMIKLMTYRNMFDEVISAITLFGVEGIDPKSLSRLCAFGIEKNKEPKDVILYAAHQAFRQGRIDTSVLQYLADNFTGTTIEMYEIWLAAKDANIDTFTLEENLIAQMLFAESCIENEYSLFLSYYIKNRNRKLIRAYISYTAYKYFVKERVTNDSFFDVLKRDPSLENSQIGMLALLKFYSTRDFLSEEEKEFCDSHIRHFLQKKMFYAFFKDFKGKLTLPASMMDKYYVEYRTNPAMQVSIHYTYNDEVETVVEPMTDLGYGIFTKEIILFHGETLQYYITENDGEQDEITVSRSINYLEEDTNDSETKYDEINSILIAVELKDYKTAIDLLEQYYRTEYAIKRHFKRL